MFHTKVRTKAAFAELGHDVFQTSQALRNRKKEVSTSWVKSTPRTNCWGKHKTYEHKELLPAFAVEGLLPYKQSSFGPLRHCFESYITIDQEAWFLIYVLSLCYVMLHHKNTPSVFIDCSSGLPVAKAATVRRKKSMELEASWSSHKFWAWPMGFPIRFDGNRIRCHTCSFPCEISIFSNKAPWQSVISESFKYSNNAPTNLFICLSHLEVRIHQNFPVCQDTCRAGEWKSEGSDAQRTPDLFWVDPIQGCGSCPGGNKTHQYEYT